MSSFRFFEGGPHIRRVPHSAEPERGDSAGKVFNNEQLSFF
jgi:hypothetical protein